ncbi:MAG: Uma2 family endonuclease [Casimicrobium sp.]
MQWSDVLADPSLRDLPFKIELNQWGLIEMSPASTWHASRQTKVVQYLTRKIESGEILTELAIQTMIGVRVADVAWRSAAVKSAHGYASPLPIAPELCVEVLSESNTDAEMSGKRAAYFAAGAQEVWLVGVDSKIVVYTRDGVQPSSAIVSETPSIPA